MFYFLFTLLVFILRAKAITSIALSVNSSFKATEKQIFFDNIDRFIERKTPLDHLIVNNITYVENEDAINLQENPKQFGPTGGSFEILNGGTRINQTTIGKGDVFTMHDDPYYKDGRLKREDETVFTLSMPKDSPYAVLLTANTSDTEKFIAQTVCSGTLIAEQWVLTAASCFESGKVVSDILIYAGGRSLKDLKGRGFIFSQTRRSSTYHSHPKYTVFDGNKAVNDIALVKAKKKFKLNEYVSVMPLSNGSWAHQGSVQCSVTGFGKVKLYVDDARDYLRKTYSFSVKKPCKCFGKETRAKSWLCSDSFSHAGVCLGDMGSGLICNKELVGVTSMLLPMYDIRRCIYRPIPFDAECDTVNMLTPFHETFPYMDWIKGYAFIVKSRNSTDGVGSEAGSTHDKIKIYLLVLVYLVSYMSS